MNNSIKKNPDDHQPLAYMAELCEHLAKQPDMKNESLEAFEYIIIVHFGQWVYSPNF